MLAQMKAPGRMAVLVLAMACASLARAASAPVNAVAWQSWSPETFARAKAENKLVLLDAAAEWCHWCHVMERTTYADPEVARLIATRFIAVRVDVDSRPEVAERYGDWGWPATIVFSSSMDEIKKMRGYIETKRFLEILNDAVAEHDRTNGKGPFRAEDPPPKPAVGDLTPARVDELRRRWEKELSTYFDAKGGGWGYRQKSSTWMNVEHALVRHAATKTDFWQWRATMTLDLLTRIMDPVWGGVYQYSTDGDWEHPHFEKLMTYQAGTLESYALTALATGDRKYEEVGEKLFGYMTQFLRDDAGAFLVSQDADLQHPTAGGAPVDGHHYYALPDAERRKLGQPRIDRAVYARENGLAIASICLLYAASQEKKHLDAASSAAGAVWGTHRARGGVSHAAGDAKGLLHLADNAAFGRGLLALYEATGQEAWFAAAREVADAMQRELWDDAEGCWFAHSADPAAVGVLKQRRHPEEDNVDAGRFFLRLSIHEDSKDRRAFADRTLRWLSAGERPGSLGRFLGAYLTFLEEATADPVHIAVVGAIADPHTAQLVREAWRYPYPHRVIERRDPAAAGLHAIAAGADTRGPPAAYVCSATGCSLPITDPSAFAEKVARFLKR